MTTSNKSAPAASSAQQMAGNGDFRAYIKSSFQSNLLAAVGVLWSVFLFVGGVIFIVYFVSIGFLPEIDLQTSIAFLVVSALTGGFLLIVLGFSLLGPGWWWLQTTRHHEPLKSPLWFILPVLGVILSIFLTQRPWALILIGVVGFIASLLILWGEKILDKLSPVTLKGAKLWGKFSPKHKWKTVGVFCLGFSPVVYVTLPFLLLREAPELSKYTIQYIIAPLALILIANTILIVNKSFSFLQILILAVLTIFLLTAQLNTWSFIPQWMMRIYKFGNIQNASLVLNEIGCAIVQHHGLEVTPYPTGLNKIDATPNPKTCSLYNVIIHSRLGSMYYLEVSRRDDTSMRFTIPGQNVLSWAVNESKKVSTAGPPASTQNPAPTTGIAPLNKGMEPTH